MKTDFWVSLTRPGPVEEAMLDELAGIVEIRRPVAAGVGLRILDLGEGPPVVLVHGRGHAATMWWPVLRALSARHRVIAIDLPGFGHSACPPFEGTDPIRALDYFSGPLEAWLASELPDGFALCGHSLGGLVSVDLHLRRRVRPSKLALIAPMGMGPEIRMASRAYFRAGPERLARWLGRRVTRALTSSLPRNPDASVLDALSHELSSVYGGREPAQRAFDALCPLRGSIFHLEDRLGEIDVPTLIVWGDHDRVFPSAVALSAAARIRGSRLSMHALDHCPHLEAPEVVVPVLESFLTDAAAAVAAPPISGRAATS